MVIGLVARARTAAFDVRDAFLLLLLHHHEIILKRGAPVVVGRQQSRGWLLDVVAVGPVCS